MKYYKAIAEKHDYFTGYTTSYGELITEKERNTKFRYLQNDCFQTVEVSKRNTVFIFGCRYEIGTSEERMNWRSSH